MSRPVRPLIPPLPQAGAPSEPLGRKPVTAPTVAPCPHTRRKDKGSFDKCLDCGERFVPENAGASPEGPDSRQPSAYPIQEWGINLLRNAITARRNRDAMVNSEWLMGLLVEMIDRYKGDLTLFANFCRNLLPTKFPEKFDQVVVDVLHDVLREGQGVSPEVLASAVRTLISIRDEIMPGRGLSGS